MDNTERIEEIKAKGTWLYLSRGEKIERVALIVLTTLTIGLVGGFVADKVAVNNVAACTNTNLGVRNAPSAADAQAHLVMAKADAAWASAIVGAFAAPPAQQAFDNLISAATVYRTATSKYEQTLADDQAERAANPLGKC